MGLGTERKSLYSPDGRAVLVGIHRLWTASRRRRQRRRLAQVMLVWRALVTVEGKLRHGPLCTGMDRYATGRRSPWRPIGKGGSELDAGQLAVVSSCLGDPD